MSRDISPIGIRLPDNLKDALYKRAKDSRRAFNAEVLVAIEAGLAAAKGLSEVSTADLVHELIRRGEHDRVVIQVHTPSDDQ